jgi:polyvinyl alcohol dehydrogenase (cytochrome)
MRRSFPIIFALALSAFSTQAADPSLGATVYQKNCAVCHEQTSPRIPTRETLKKMPAARVLRSLDWGAMMSVAFTLNRNEREAVAAYVGSDRPDAAPPTTAYCSDRTVRPADSAKSSWNGWGPSSDNMRFQLGTGLTIDQVRHLKLKWAFGYEGDITAFALPTVLDRQVFVGSAGGMVHALSADSGCLEWEFQANGPVRSAIIAAPLGKKHALLFGDQTGWFYSLDAETGRLLWKKKIEEHDTARLTGSPVAHEGIVYVPVASWEESRALNPLYPCCTFRGSVVALRIHDGAQIWKSYTVPEEPKQTSNREGVNQWGPSGAGVWSAPTLDLKRGVLYVSTGNNYSSPATPTSDAILAMDLKSGRMVWSKQIFPSDAYNASCRDKAANCPEEKGPDYDFASPAMLVRAGDSRDLLVAGQKSGIVSALDPDRKGEIVWQTRVGQGSALGGVQWGMASDGQKVYAPNSDVGRTRRTGGDPTDPRRYVLDPKQGGGLTALRVTDGSKAWYAPPAACGDVPGCSPGQSAAVSAIPGAVFSGSLDGHLRAFASEDGAVLWDFDTARDFTTANGVSAKGGAIDGPGPVIANGMVFVNSGYAPYGGMPGNVLLAFAPDGQ